LKPNLRCLSFRCVHIYMFFGLCFDAVGQTTGKTACKKHYL